MSVDLTPIRAALEAAGVDAVVFQKANYVAAETKTHGVKMVPFNATPAAFVSFFTKIIKYPPA